MSVFNPSPFVARILLLPIVFVCAAWSLKAQSVTFTGRVTDQNTGQGIAGVAIAAQGNQTGTRVAVTDTQGNYTLPFGANSNIRLRAYRTQYVFNPVVIGFFSPGGLPIVGTIQQDFSGLALPFSILIFGQSPIILTEDGSLNALGLDGVFQTRDPLAVANNNYFGSDKRTRLQLYVFDLDLFSGETTSIISATAIDAQQVSHALAVEDLRKVPDVPWMSQLTLRLPSDLTGPSDPFVTVTVRGQPSVAARIHIK